MKAAAIPKLEAESRDRTGTRYAARLRSNGRLPAVIYGHKRDPIHVSLGLSSLVEIIHGHHQLVEVVMAGQSESCLIKDLQWDYMGDQVIHVDLARVDLAEQVTVEVEIELVGEPIALQEIGAILTHPQTTVEVQCRADSIPDKIQHDIEELGIGEAVTAGGLNLPQDVVLSSDVDTMIAQISIVQEMPEEEEAAETTAGEEPEVIGKDTNQDTGDQDSE